jgi:type IV secretory pathway VirB6-like protein
MNWDIFTAIYDFLATPLVAGVDAMNAGLSRYVAPILKAAIILSLAVRFLLKMFRPTTEPLGELWTNLLMAAGVVFIVASTANYGSYVRDMAMKHIPNEISAALAGASNGRQVTGAMYQEVWAKAYDSGLAVFRALPWGFMTIPLGGLICLYWVVAIASTAIAFFFWMRSVIFIALLVGTGVLFIALCLFPLVRGMARGWFETLMAVVIFQFMSAALFTMIMTAETQLLAVIANEAKNGNEFIAIAYLLAAMVLFFGVGWMVWQLNGIANSIAHGFSGHATQLGRRAWNQMPRPVMPFSQPPAPVRNPAQSVPSVPRVYPAPARSLSGP